MRERVLHADQEGALLEAGHRLALRLAAVQLALEESQRQRFAAGVFHPARFGEREQRRAVADLVLDQHALPGAALLGPDVEGEPRQRVVEDSGHQAGLEVAFDHVVEDRVELLQAPRLRPSGQREDDHREPDADRRRHAVEPDRMRARRAEREQLLVGGEASQAKLHAEHERERHGDDEEVGRERGGDARQVAQGHRAAEDHFVELQELQDDEELQDGQQTDAERHRDLAQQHAVEERHRRPL